MNLVGHPITAISTQYIVTRTLVRVKPHNFCPFTYITYMDKEIFTQRLKSKREALGLTQKQLATAIGISERGYQHYESASDFKPPSSVLLFAISETLDISVDYLLGRTTNPKVK